MNSNYNRYTFEIGQSRYKPLPIYETTNGIIGSKIVEFLKLQSKFHNNMLQNEFLKNKTVNEKFWVTAGQPDIIVERSGQERIIQKKLLLSVPIDVYQFTLDMLIIGTNKIQ